MKKILSICMCVLMLTCSAYAEEIYRIRTESGDVLTMLGTTAYVGDEYISGDNARYKIVSVSAAEHTAVARYMGKDESDAEAFAAYAKEEKRICMYSTHSDESYVPDDGTSSKTEDAGIFDVGAALKENLEKKGIEVVYSRDTFYPHDAGAYNRSRPIAEELLKKSPDALFDVHRDAIPAEQYETTVDGDSVSKVRLFVGRSNPNADANKAFAKEIKAAADREYPNLIKDIYIGKGNYNQELFGHALLLEMGTHEIDKDKAIASTEYLADVIDAVLYGESASAETDDAPARQGVAKGIAWAIGLAIVGAIVYALASTGTISGMWKKIRKGFGKP